MKMQKKNLEIRRVIEKSGAKYWQVAHKLGISEVTFSVRLRKELSDYQKRRVYEAIECLKKEEQ